MVACYSFGPFCCCVVRVLACCPFGCAQLLHCWRPWLLSLGVCLRDVFLVCVVGTLSVFFVVVKFGVLYCCIFGVFCLGLFGVCCRCHCSCVLLLSCLCLFVVVL